MTLVQAIADRLNPRAGALGDYDAMIALATAGSTSAVGRVVSESTSLQTSAVYACVRLLAETIASLPLITYRRLPGGGKERAPDVPLYQLLHDEPNPEMTSMEYREATTGHVVLRGNSYSEIQRDTYGAPIALWPLRPDRMTVSRNEQSRLVYDYRLPGGTTKRFSADQILHIRGLSSNGLVGYDPITMAAQSIGITLATEEFAARFFGNGSQPGGVLKHQKTLTAEAAKRLKESWESAHGGLSNSQRVAVLEEGITWEAIGIAPEQAQFLESRKFQTREIARWFRVQPHMIADLEQATFSNIEHQGMEFVTYTLRPWLVRIEQRLGASLLTRADRTTYFIEHLIDGLMRGDSITRATALQIQRQNGVINADEWREIENRNPLPNGEGQTYIVPLNMAPAGAPADPDGGQGGNQ